jgi:hypothetical protein
LTTGINDTGRKFATGINDPAANFATSFTSVFDTGSKFATGVNDTGGKFAAGVNYTGGKLPPVSLTLKILLICHRCQRHRWLTLSCEYLREFSKKFDTILMGYSGAEGKLIDEKNQKQKIS